MVPAWQLSSGGRWYQHDSYPVEVDGTSMYSHPVEVDGSSMYSCPVEVDGTSMTAIQWR